MAKLEAGISREGAELCGWELDELMERTIAAMQSFAPDQQGSPS